jgi:translation initiation factor RLI1
MSQLRCAAQSKCLSTISGGITVSSLYSHNPFLCRGALLNLQVDEPSAYLDSEQRIAASKVIKRFIMHAKKTAFVVEHDFIMATYLADRCVHPRDLSFFGVLSPVVFCLSVCSTLWR